MRDIAQAMDGGLVRKSLLLAAVCGVFGACATPARVHLFTDIMDQASVEELGDEIRGADMALSVSAAGIPESVRRPTIVVPTIVREQRHIRELQRLMQDAGYPDVQVELYSPGTHSFTPDNIGLYVTDEEAARRRTDDAPEDVTEPDSSLARVYVSECPATDAELNLYANGAVMLEVFEWDESENREYSTYTAGDWSSEEGAVTIDLETDRSLRYTINRFERAGRSGTYRGIELLGSEEADSYQGCDFHYTNFVPVRG